MSAAGADWTPAVIRAPTATITSKAFAMSSSLLSPIRRSHRRPGFVVGVMAACFTLRAAEILLAEPGEDHRRDDQHEPERADHAAQHRGRMVSSPGPVLLVTPALVSSPRGPQL